MGLESVIEGRCPSCGAELERREDCGWCPACGVGHSMTMVGGEGEYRLHLELDSSAIDFSDRDNRWLRTSGPSKVTFIRPVTQDDAEG